MERISERHLPLLRVLASIFATAANTSAFSTRYGVICADVYDRAQLLASSVGASFDAPLFEGRRWIALFDNNPKGKGDELAKSRSMLMLALFEQHGWLPLADGGAGEIEGETEPYTDCGIWDVPAELAADGAHEAERMYRAAAVKLGLASNGINF